MKSIKAKKVNVVKNLISHIKVMYYNNDPMLNSVDDVNILYNALCELDEIIGMDEVKDSIVKQIKFLLVNYSGDKNKFENHMLHTVVFGPPGVGKTTVGSCLANIWKGLGLIEKRKLNEKQHKFGNNRSNDNNHNNNNNNNNSKNIRILPIPIFLMKNKGENDPEDTKFDENDARQIELSIKTHFGDESNRGAFEVPDDEKSKNVIHTSNHGTKKRRMEQKDNLKDDSEINQKIKSLKDELDELTKREVDSVDDKRRYVIEFAEYKRKMREFKLLSCGIKNLIKVVDCSNIKPPLKRIKIESPIRIVSRPDFVGQFVGHTCDKTQKLLTSTLEEGKVLFIDEAYSIVLDEKDSFGHEALNELNRFMSEHPELVVIFAGYKDKMESTLFRYQPGFKRRCTWVFEISNYTGEMLADIFKKQLQKESWIYEGDNSELSKFFESKITNFDAFGGDTIRMALYCKLKFAELKFDNASGSKLKHKTITLEILKTAYTDLYCKNKPEKDEHVGQFWRDMYV